MGTMMRGRHQPDDKIVREDNGDGTFTLTCTDGWTYVANEQFVDAVERRHAMEGNLLDS